MSVSQQVRPRLSKPGLQLPGLLLRAFLVIRWPMHPSGLGLRLRGAIEAGVGDTSCCACCWRSTSRSASATEETASVGMCRASESSSENGRRTRRVARPVAPTGAVSGPKMAPCEAIMAPRGPIVAPCGLIMGPCGARTNVGDEDFEAGDRGVMGDTKSTVVDAMHLGGVAEGVTDPSRTIDDLVTSLQQTPASSAGAAIEPDDAAWEPKVL